MGTVSLVFGMIFIGFGLFVGLWAFVEMIQATSPDYALYGLGFLVFVVPMFIGGALLLRKFDKDRKKDTK